MLDKTKMDWQGFKATDKNVQEELAAHARSDKQYLDKQVGAAVGVAVCRHQPPLLLAERLPRCCCCLLFHVDPPTGVPAAC